MHRIITYTVTREYLDRGISYTQLRDILTWLDNQLGVWDADE